MEAGQQAANCEFSDHCKNCIVHGLLCIFLIIIIPSFAVLLNCLYLNPQVLLFICFPPHLTGGEGGVRERLCDLSCCLPG